jgi:uracil-DNA glycosylase family 4
MAVQRSESSTAPFVPEERSLQVLREAMQECRGCDLYQPATQAVFGEIERPAGHGSSKVSVMMVGEQPGDKEDVEGRPLVGSAGNLLDHCLEAAGIDRRTVYITNAVKHFKGEPRGKIRLHKKPTLTETWACATRVSRSNLWIGRGERIRTSGPLLPKQVRYQAALRPDHVERMLEHRVPGRPLSCHKQALV